jgi:hypothetical protein
MLGINLYTTIPIPAPGSSLASILKFRLFFLAVQASNVRYADFLTTNQERFRIFLALGEIEISSGKYPCCLIKSCILKVFFIIWCA